MTRRTSEAGTARITMVFGQGMYDALLGAVSESGLYIGVPDLVRVAVLEYLAEHHPNVLKRRGFVLPNTGGSELEEKVTAIAPETKED